MNEITDWQYWRDMCLATEKERDALLEDQHKIRDLLEQIGKEAEITGENWKEKFELARKMRNYYEELYGDSLRTAAELAEGVRNFKDKNDSLLEENARLRTRIKDVEKDRDSWKSEWEMWSKAWMREIGKVFPKTHMIDSLVLTTRWMRETLEFHPRATKLMSKRKNFLVVAEDEHYFAYVYRIIRGSEKAKGNWTAEDERLYQCAISRAALQSLNADVSVETQEESSR